MRITIEDLEALKELNDELEENHIETERQLNEDLGMMKCDFLRGGLTIIPEFKETQIREHAGKIEALEDNILDLDGTIVQFRELVVHLQQ